MNKTLLFVFVSVIANLNLKAQLENSLVLHIPVDNSVVDVKGKTIANNGASLTLDRFGRSNNALSFNGTSNYLSGDFQNLELDSFSYSVWVKFDQHPANGQVLFIMNAGGNTKDAGINIANNYAGYTGFSGFSYTTSGSSVNYTTGSLPSKGAWHHIVLSRFTDKVQVYVDGTLAGTSAASSSADYSGSNLGFWVGSRFGTGNYFAGIVDDIRIYNRPISATEVQELYTITNFLETSKAYSSVISFPNPSTGKINLIHPTIHKKTIMKVYNSSGMELSANFSIKLTDGQVEIDIPQSGVFFIQFESEGVHYRSKVVVFN